MKTFISKSKNKFIFRTPHEKDAIEMHRFINRLIAEDTYILRSAEDRISLNEEKAWIKAKLTEIKEGNLILITAFFDNKVVASVHVEVGEFRGRYLGKLGISVDKDFRNQGLASELIKDAESEARKLRLKIIHLEVFVKNKIAHDLYKKLGYKKFGMLPKSIDYRGKMLDEVYLYKRLD